MKYTPDQIRKMEEFIRIRRASEPVELIKLVRLILDLQQICLRRTIYGLSTFEFVLV